MVVLCVVICKDVVYFCGVIYYVLGMVMGENFVLICCIVFIGFMLLNRLGWKVLVRYLISMIWMGLLLNRCYIFVVWLV